METLITASIGLVVSITNAAQQVKTLRQKCHALAKQVQLLQPFLKEVLEQARLKNRGEKLFSANDENAFKNLHSALERANKYALIPVLLLQEMVLSPLSLYISLIGLLLQNSAGSAKN